MAKKGTAHYSKKTPQLEHNDRTKDEAKTIHKELSHLNEYTCTSQEIQTRIDELYSKAQNNFYEYCKNKNGLAKSGKPKGLQNFTKKEKCYHEFIYEINENTTMEQCEKLTEQIAELTGFTPLQISIHRDEGHYNKNGDFVTHYHAHATFFTLDKNTGLQLARIEASLTKENLSKIQDLTAQTLQMERGERRFERGEKKNYIQDYKEYARVKEQEREILDKASEIQNIALETQENALKLKNDLDLREIDLKLKENDLNAKESDLKQKIEKLESDHQTALDNLKQDFKKQYSLIKNIITFGKHNKRVNESYEIAKSALLTSKSYADTEIKREKEKVEKAKKDIDEAEKRVQEMRKQWQEATRQNDMLREKLKEQKKIIDQAEREILKGLDFNAEMNYLQRSSNYREGLSDMQIQALNNELTRRLDQQEKQSQQQNSQKGYARSF
ncbi:mobilization protein [Campylobacter upsaliensis]